MFQKKCGIASENENVTTRLNKADFLTNIPCYYDAILKDFAVISVIMPRLWFHKLCNEYCSNHLRCPYYKRLGTTLR